MNPQACARTSDQPCTMTLTKSHRLHLCNSQMLLRSEQAAVVLSDELAIRVQSDVNYRRERVGHDCGDPHQASRGQPGTVR